MISRRIAIGLAALALSACGTLERKAVLINPGDSKDAVIKVMGIPGDRQFRGQQEAWQYCITGAGFGYHDYRIIWFEQGRVTGITSYKNGAPGVSCKSQFTAIHWENAPDATVEVRNR